jgi:hypothetical protein
VQARRRCGKHIPHAALARNVTGMLAGELARMQSVVDPDGTS